MLLKPRYGLVALAALVVVTGTAHATIMVSIEPANQFVNIGDGFANVDIVALIPEEDATVGWGLDLELAGTSVSFSSAMVNEVDFDAVTGIDGDPFAAIVPTPPGTAVWADPTVVLLATVTLSIDDFGTTTLSLGDDNPADLTEGFALNPPPAGEFASVIYEPGTVTVVPEPAALGLFVLAGAALAWRRRTKN